MNIKLLKVNCIDCGKELLVNIAYSHNSAKLKQPNPQFRCHDCSRKLRSEKMKERMATMPEEEKAKMYEKAGKNHSKFLAKLPEEEKKQRMIRINIGRDKWKKNVTPDELERISKAHTESNKRRWDSMSEEERIAYIEKTHKAWNEKVDKEKFAQAIRDRWKSYSPEQKSEIIRKIIKNSKKDNGLERRFERTFNSSHLVNDFICIREFYVANNGVDHHWDFGICNKHGDLVCLVDLDGQKYHADNIDYDGFTAKEDYDEKRWLSIPNGIKSWIINENAFNEGFIRLIKMLYINYDEYIDSIFDEMRNQPFPEPHYSDKELIDSWNSVSKIDINNSGVNLSLNTRVGDRLIQHFHHSIWHDHRKGELSPYQAWQDDKLLRKCIENRIIYQTHLNPNKILQGFNVSKIAPKVSVFSAGRASIIIQKYLSEFNTVFDPFSGYSGRMLGAISLGKHYIGQDLSISHVNESNKLLEFLRDTCCVSMESTVECKNILQSSGEYECLFTCPPYSDKEQWLDVPVDKRSCDDWIDECLWRFKCKRYVFVVDNTDKYKGNIVDDIQNASHFGIKTEKLIVMTK